MRFFLCLLLLLAGPALAQTDLRQHPAFHSQILATDRDIAVYLPPGYDAHPAERYPVLYMQDEQALFGDSVSPYSNKGWEADRTAQALIAQGRIRPLIIVGIANGGETRIDDYTQTFSEQLKKGGKADLYGRMLVEEVKPFIDSHYRTIPGDAGLGGSSLGGLVTMYLGLKYPAVFDRLAVVSPSVWWGDRQILKDVASIPARTPARIWVDIGTDEGKQPEIAVNDARMLRDALIAKGWKLDGDLAYFEDRGAKHSEGPWARRFGPILEFLYKN